MSGRCMYNAQGFLLCDKAKTKEGFEEAGITLPSGSFNNNCKNCSLTNDVLTCTCRNNRGNYSKTSDLEINACVNKDINIDYHGALLCHLPKGSYLTRCMGCSLDNDTLSCLCMNPYHRYSSTSLNVKKCQGDISNKDGVLQCNTA